MLKLYSFGEEDTIDMGYRLGLGLKIGDVVVLNGELGAGKTCFAKGIAKGLDISDYISSPTFSLINEYKQGRIPLYHIDAYRVNNPNDNPNICFDDYIFGDGICVIEWGMNISEIIPQNSIMVDIMRNGDKDDDKSDYKDDNTDDYKREDYRMITVYQNLGDGEK